MICPRGLSGSAERYNYVPLKIILSNSSLLIHTDLICVTLEPSTEPIQPP
jgi:hypothetical protein